MLEIGQQAPDFALPGIDGQTHRLSDLLRDHRAVAVIFSCNHCPYVRAWEGRMIDLQREYAERGVALVAINPNDDVRYPDDSFEAMKQRAQEQGFNFRYLRDESQEVARAYGAVCTPDFFGFNAAGLLQYRGRLDAGRTGPPPPGSPRELYDAMRLIAATGRGPEQQIPGIGCSIKWRQG